jgi:hypothetical protein
MNVKRTEEVRYTIELTQDEARCVYVEAALTPKPTPTLGVLARKIRAAAGSEFSI